MKGELRERERDYVYMVRIYGGRLLRGKVEELIVTEGCEVHPFFHAADALALLKLGNGLQFFPLLWSSIFLDHGD